MRRPPTPIQRAAMLAILTSQQRGEGGPTLDELAATLGRSKARAVEIVDILEKRGEVAWPRRAGGKRLARSMRVVGGSAP